MYGTEFFNMLTTQPIFHKIPPNLINFFKEYLTYEKVIEFKGKYIINMHFPPYPSPAFDNFFKQFITPAQEKQKRLYSVNIGITNRCNFNCWHCYNANRSNKDMSLETLSSLSKRLMELGAVMIALSGGEPLLRDDLEDIVALFDNRVCLTVGTTGYGLTYEKAEKLFKKGLFGIGISLDSINAEEHDFLRGKKGAFEIAINAIKNTKNAGLYPYIVTVASHKLMQNNNFIEFIKFAGETGANEVHLLEPCPVGRLKGQDDVVMKSQERAKIFELQRIISKDSSLPIFSSYAYLESPDAFGCGAGLTQLYIDGSGEVCPCQFIPLSFGNVINESLDDILSRMNKYFQKPNAVCIGHIIGKHIPQTNKLPLSIEISEELCNKYLLKEHKVPKFFQIRDFSENNSIGTKELMSVYDNVHKDYDKFWLTQAALPIDNMINKIEFKKNMNIFEAGCGTGYCTAILGQKNHNTGNIDAVDISEGMLREAKKRIKAYNLDNINFILGDALEILEKKQYDLIISSWVLGYIPLRQFFVSAFKSLKNKGILAFIVHKDNSPKEPLEIFRELIAQNPLALNKQVDFDFPKDIPYTTNLLKEIGFTVKHVWDGQIIFQYESPDVVLEHLLKSGAGTAYYEAVDVKYRDALMEEFKLKLAAKHRSKGNYKVIHDYLGCIATKGMLL